MIIINKNRLSFWIYLGFIVHCGDCELFSNTMQLIHLHHTFGLNLCFLMNCGDCQLFPTQFIFVNLLMIPINKSSISVLVDSCFIVHFGNHELFSH